MCVCMCVCVRVGVGECVCVGRVCVSECKVYASTKSREQKCAMRKFV